MLPIFRTNFTNLSNFDQTAICLLDILPFTLAVCLRAEGGDIVTCRVARLSQDHLRLDLVFCSKCGSANLEVCYTSKTLGPRLCSTCVGSMVECGAWKENQVKSPVRGHLVA